jgi:hypothetical protein
MSDLPSNIDAEIEKIFKTPNLRRRIKRKIKFFIQRWTRGWDDSETWGLDSTIAKFTLPRLKRFKELKDGIPMGFTEKSWNETLDKMIFALGLCLDEDRWFEGAKEEQEALAARVQEGLELFGKYFRSLWW